MITTILNALLPLAQIYFLWRILRELRVISRDSEKREELKKQIRDFGLMFAQAADVPKPPPRTKVVTFKAEA